MSIYKYNINTEDEFDILNIDKYIHDAILKSDRDSGALIVFCPHTTAAITINENGDPDVKRDLKYAFNKISPKLKEYKHLEGNTNAHLLSTLIGVSEHIIFENKRPILGIWQSVYFCEFDGPRSRNLYIKVI